jgi:protein required for attachment to host cells
MKARQYLYLIASDQEFRLLRGQATDLGELAHRRAGDFPDVKDRFPSEPSRGHSGTVSYGVNDRGTHEAEERRRLARHVVAALEAEWAKAHYDGILLAAGPKMLGTLRDAMPKALAGQVVAKLAKTLTDIPAHALPDHFAAISKV